MKKGYGYADLEAATPVNPERHLSRPGSVSKLFTWTSVMQLAEQRKLDLNADVGTYIHQFEVPNKFDTPMTLSHILPHTPGLEDGAAGYLFGNSEDDFVGLAETLGSHIPAQVRPPGTYSSYSNWAAALAGLVVANVSGMTFEDYVQENIFNPLGVQLLQPDTVELMHSNLFRHHPADPAWAHGFYEYRRNGQRFIGHGGDTIAFHSQLLLDADNNFGFFISFNAADGARARTAIVDGIIDYFYPATPLPHAYTPLEGSAERIARVAGAYRMNRRAYTELEGAVGLVGDLMVAPAGQGAISFPGSQLSGRFIETDPFVFTQQSGQAMVTFGTDGNGNVTHSFVGLLAADKLPLLEQASTHQLVIAPALLACVFVIINAVRKRGQQSLSGAALWGKRSLVAAATANLLFVRGLLVTFASFDMEMAIFDFPPPGTAVVLIFPVLSALSTLAAVILLLPVWRSPQCNVWSRIRYSYVTGIFLALCLVLNYWNMIGWKYF